MKLIVLVNGSMQNFEQMMTMIDSEKSFLVNTEYCNDDLNEYRCLVNSIDYFLKTDKDVMIARYSGKDSISKNVGDECSEMVITLSDNKKSRYYTEKPIAMFTSLINIFD